MLISSQVCLSMSLCLCICEIRHVCALFVFDIASFSPPLQCPFPSRRSQHTDDSALLVVRALHKMILNNCVQILEISWCAFRNDLYTIKHDGHRY